MLRVWPWSRFYQQDCEIKKLKQKVRRIQRKQLEHDVRKRNRESWLKFAALASTTITAIITIAALTHWF